jgi:hypothetical protein
MAAGPPLRFLTPEWMAALTAAAAADPAVAAAAPAGGVVVRHEVTACPPDGRTVAYTVCAEAAGTARVVPTAVGAPGGDGSDEDPTASFSAPYDAALAVLRGDANAQTLLADGRLRVHGDLDALARLAGWFEALARSWAPVRARTQG